MELNFNVTREERKTLVRAVSEITGREAVYLGAPSFAFTVGDYAIDRNGTLISNERADTEDVRRLLAGLTERGFVFEGDIDEIAPVTEQGEQGGEPAGAEDRPLLPEHMGSSVEDMQIANQSESVNDEDSGKLAIHMPLSGFTDSSLDNLEKLVAAKAWVFKKMAGTDALPIERDEEYLRFPWFRPDASIQEIDAYSALITRLCETAKTKKRVAAEERPLLPGDNEKFKARCTLLALGFIGPEFAQARKILLAPMSGDGSHKTGNGKKAAPVDAQTADSSNEPCANAGEVEVTETADSADTCAVTCGSAQ